MDLKLEDDSEFLKQPVNSLVCQECLQFLSMGPVTITENNKLLCGRCVIGLSENKRLTKSLFNIVATMYIFRCVNYYDGCNTLLSFNEAIEHEKNCSTTLRECIFCSFTGNLCQIIHHYKVDHEDNFLSDGIVNISRLGELKKSFIFCDAQYILHTQYSFKKSSKKITAFVSSVNGILPSNEQYELTLFEGSTRLKFKEVRFNTSFVKHLNVVFADLSKVYCKISTAASRRLDLHEQKLLLDYRVLKVHKNEKTLQDLNTKNITLQQILKNISHVLGKCAYCERYKTGTFYMCLLKHICCRSCMNIDQCPICNNTCDWLKLKGLNIKTVNCDTEGCKEEVSILSYGIHRRDCEFRIMSCPLPRCTFSGHPRELEGHWHSNSLALYVNKEVILDTTKFRDLYYMQNNELFRVTFNREEGGKLTIFVDNIDVMMPYNVDYSLSSHQLPLSFDINIEKRGLKTKITEKWSYNQRKFKFQIFIGAK